jgi:fibronectin type 3 domain-containing protein
VTVPGGSTTASFPATINPVTITAQAGGVAETATINLSEAYQVALNWNPPATSPDPVAGYDVFRATGGSTAFAQINTALVTGTAFIDATVADEATYDYIVESVDASGVKSVPSNMAAVLVP